MQKKGNRRDLRCRACLTGTYWTHDSTVYNSTYDYDADSRLTDLAYNNGVTLAAYHWVYDADSRVADVYSLADELWARD
jgi:hypothetical protein